MHRSSIARPRLRPQRLVQEAEQPKANSALPLPRLPPDVFAANVFGKLLPQETLAVACRRRGPGRMFGSQTDRAVESLRQDDRHPAGGAARQARDAVPRAVSAVDAITHGAYRPRSV